LQIEVDLEGQEQNAQRIAQQFRAMLDKKDPTLVQTQSSFGAKLEDGDEGPQGHTSARKDEVDDQDEEGPANNLTETQATVPFGGSMSSARTT